MFNYSKGDVYDKILLLILQSLIKMTQSK